MAREIVSGTVRIATIGKPEDYINLPIVKDDIAIGIVTNCVEDRFQYKLTVTLWQDASVELINGKPNAVKFEF